MMNATETTAASAGWLDEMLTRRELSDRLKIKLRTLENWQRRIGLPRVKIGKIVRFHWPSVVEHLQANHQVCWRARLDGEAVGTKELSAEPLKRGPLDGKIPSPPRSPVLRAAASAPTGAGLAKTANTRKAGATWRP